MNKKQMKCIRQAFKDELAKGSSQGWIAHSQYLKSPFGEHLLRYSFQYINTGGKRLVKIAKKIYKQSGVLPRRRDA